MKQLFFFQSLNTYVPYTFIILSNCCNCAYVYLPTSYKNPRSTVIIIYKITGPSSFYSLVFYLNKYYYYYHNCFYWYINYILCNKIYKIILGKSSFQKLFRNCSLINLMYKEYNYFHTTRILPNCSIVVLKTILHKKLYN